MWLNSYNIVDEVADGCVVWARRRDCSSSTRGSRTSLIYNCLCIVFSDVFSHFVHLFPPFLPLTIGQINCYSTFIANKIPSTKTDSKFNIFYATINDFIITLFEYKIKWKFYWIVLSNISILLLKKSLIYITKKLFSKAQDFSYATFKIENVFDVHQYIFIYSGEKWSNFNYCFVYCILFCLWDIGN